MKRSPRRRTTCGAAHGLERPFGLGGEGGALLRGGRLDGRGFGLRLLKKGLDARGERIAGRRANPHRHHSGNYTLPALPEHGFLVALLDELRVGMETVNVVEVFGVDRRPA